MMMVRDRAICENRASSYLQVHLNAKKMKQQIEMISMASRYQINLYLMRMSNL